MLITHKKCTYRYLLMTVLILALILIKQSHQQKIKTLSNRCLCDVTVNCDFECCCDPQCPTNLKNMLGKYGKCNDDGFGIPLCDATSSNATQYSEGSAGVGASVHLDDLYSGLRTIYTIIKKLFCVQRVNIVDSTSFYNKISTQLTITDTISRLDWAIWGTTFETANIASLPKASINGLFYASQMGTCIRTNSIPSNIGTDIFRECRAFLDTVAIGTSPFLSIAQIITNFPNIKVYKMSQIVSTAVSDTTLVTSCPTATTCTNVIRYLKLFINPTTNAFRSDLSYAVIGDLENVQTNSYVIVKYDYTYLNEDGTFPKLSNIGYSIGTPLQLLKRSTNGYLRILNPINMAFRKANGDCRTISSDSVDESLIQLRLGRNQFHSCVGSNSLIYNNIKDTFDYIGVVGSSGNVLADYVAVDWPTQTSDSTNTVLKIYYVKVGATQNPQYYVVKALVEAKTSTGNQKTLFIQYQQVQSTSYIYLPPPPKVDAYLPNDFLFPFYVAQ